MLNRWTIGAVYNYLIYRLVMNVEDTSANNLIN